MPARQDEHGEVTAEMAPSPAPTAYYYYFDVAWLDQSGRRAKAGAAAYHVFHGAAPLVHMSLRSCISRKVSMHCQKPLCLNTDS